MNQKKVYNQVESNFSPNRKGEVPSGLCGNDCLGSSESNSQS